MTTTLTPKQEVLIRQFYTEVLGDDRIFNGDAKATRRGAIRCCLDLLGYIVYDGKHVRQKDVEGGVTFGKKLDVEDRWLEDTMHAYAVMDAVMEAEDEANSGKDTDKADSSKSSSNTKVRKTVLSKDV